MTERAQILLVDDEANIRRMLAALLREEGFTVAEAANGNAALLQVDDVDPDVILLDLLMPPGPDGLETLAALRERGRTIPVIMMSGKAQLTDAVRAVKLGAFQFLEKPLTPESVLVTVRAALELNRTRAENRALQAELARRSALVGESAAMQQVRALIARVAPTEARVLLSGESGTGKELAAAAVHAASRRSTRAFVTVNCAAIPRDLVESEMFGHERGAFTGADERALGKFDAAQGGTIFLDEIGDMSLSAQAKVLRVLQTGEFARVGGEQTLRTDCRVVAATNKELDKAVAAGEFREDLFFRLNVVPINSPPLRDRLDDVPLLAESFVAECCDENGFARKSIDSAVLDKLRGYDWPGNVRELRNVVERLVIMSDDVIVERDLPPYLGGPGRIVGERGESPPAPSVDIARHAEKTLREFREEVECDFIRYKLAEYDWNISRTAQALGIERTNLHKKMRALGIVRP